MVRSHVCAVHSYSLQKPRHWENLLKKHTSSRRKTANIWGTCTHLFKPSEMLIKVNITFHVVGPLLPEIILGYCALESCSLERRGSSWPSMCCSVLRCVVIGFITQTAASQLPSSLPSLTWWDNRPNLSAERERERNRNREWERERRLLQQPVTSTSAVTETEDPGSPKRATGSVSRDTDHANSQLSSLYFPLALLFPCSPQRYRPFSLFLSCSLFPRWSLLNGHSLPFSLLLLT